MKSIPARILLATVLAALFFVHAGHIWRIGALDRIENVIYDFRLSLTAPTTRDDRIVVVDIDEKSLAEIGQWPWSRDRVAEMVRKLTDEQQVAIIGFDVVFVEPDGSSGINRLREAVAQTPGDQSQLKSAVEALAPKLDFDAIFAETLKQRPVVMGYYFSDFQPPRRQGAIPLATLGKGVFGNRPIEFQRYNGYGANLPMLQANALSAGHFNMVPDADGVLRRVGLLVEFDGQYYESLALAMVRQLVGGSKLIPGFSPDQRWVPSSYYGVETLEMDAGRGRLSIPVDKSVAALIPYRAFLKERDLSAGFRYVSAVDVIKSRLAPAELKGKIILVGTTAPGLVDARVTPISSVFPGVEVHASLISGMLDGTLSEAPPYLLGAEVLLLFLTLVVLGVGIPMMSPIKGLALTFIVLIGHVALNVWLFKSAHIVMPLASSFLLACGIFVLNSVYGYFVESRGKRELARLFGNYVPPELVEEMARDPERYSMEGRSAELTVLFADVRDFTSISEKLPPKELAQLINRYLTVASEQIQSNRGTLDKYVGDMAMAFWGAPIEDPDHQRHGVEAALGMAKAVAALSEEFKARGWPEIRIGIGLNSGPMIVGDMGSKVRRAYTVMGDTVNLGSRLEGLTKKYGVVIMAAEATRKAVPELVWRELDRVRVKGKAEAVAVYEPVGPKGELPKEVTDELAIWQQFLKLYRAQQWDLAEMQLVNLRNRRNATLYNLYGARIANLRAHPPGPDWDGVEAFTEK